MKNLRGHVITCSFLLFFSANYAHLATHQEHNFYFDVDYLAWKAQEDQTQYAALLPGGLPANNDPSFTLRPQVVNQHFNFDSGVQITAGYFWCDDMETRFKWTHFHQHSCCAVASDSNTGIIAVLLADPGISGQVTNFGTQANSNWKLHYDFLNLDVGKIITLCSNGTIETSLGVAAARIHQLQAVGYAHITVDGVTNPQAVNVLRCNTFNAGGLHAEVDINWNLLCNIDLIGSASAALLAGKFKAKSSNYFVGDNKTITTSICANRVRPLFDVNLGFAWHSDYFDCADIGLHILFEAVYTPDQWQAPSSLLATVSGYLPGGGDLTLYGVTVGVDVAF